MSEDKTVKELFESKDFQTFFTNINDEYMKRHIGELMKDHAATINTCPDPECSLCAILLCPHREPLHFHHDGCPVCSFDPK